MSEFLVTVDRLEEFEGSTISVLKVNGVNMGYALEDGHNDPKIMGETRIPAGTYDLKLRTVGGFHGRYTTRFGDMHIGMIELQDVPNFKYILMHTGNTKEHTNGCILCGSYYEQKGEDGYFLGRSRTTYKKIYPIIAKAIEAGEDCKIRIKDE
jgi:hypothetical protein